MKTVKPPMEKLNLRLSPDLKASLQTYADQAGVSLNTACVLAIQNFLPFALKNLRFLRAAAKPQAAASTSQVVPSAGRNDPCPCGSGKKYKFCHGNG